MFRRQRGSTRAGTILLAAGAIAVLTAAGAGPARAHVTAGALSAARDSSKPGFSGTLTSSVTAQLKIASAPQGVHPAERAERPVLGFAVPRQRLGLGSLRRLPAACD
jgi:hypothetical protein